MSRLASHVELLKLEAALACAPTDLAFLQSQPATSIKILRQAFNDQVFAQDRKLFERIASVLRWLPARFVAFLAERLFGALLTARVASVIQARRAARIVAHLSADFLAEACASLDPRCARDLIRLLPDAQITEIALALLRRGDYLTMGQFVDVLRDETIAAVLTQLPDEEVLLRIAACMESRNRLDHVVRLLPDERLRKTILLVLDPAREVMTEVLFLIAHVGYGLQRELGDLAAAQDEAVLGRIIDAVQTRNWWADLLPILVNLSEGSQRKVVNLPILKRDPAVLEAALRAADEYQLWSALLPLVNFMDSDTRDIVARIASALPITALEHAANAALVAEQWAAVLDVVARMPEARQVEVATVIRPYGRVDAQLLQQIVTLGRSLGVCEAAEREALLS